jgi:hypothetical protein
LEENFIFETNFETFNSDLLKNFQIIATYSNEIEKIEKNLNDNEEEKLDLEKNLNLISNFKKKLENFHVLKEKEENKIINLIFFKKIFNNN